MRNCQSKKLIATVSAVSVLMFFGFASVSFASETDDPEDELIFALDEEEEIDRSVFYEEGELLVSFDHDTSWEEIDQLVKAEAADYTIIDDGESHIDPDLPEEDLERLKVIADIESDKVICAYLQEDDTVEAAYERFEAYDCVSNVSANICFYEDGSITTSDGTISTDDPRFNDDRQWQFKKINLPKAWNRFDTVSGRRRVVVAVIDCGVQIGHPDLDDVILLDKSVDITQPCEDPDRSHGNYLLLSECADSVSDNGQYTSSHGTMVAGVIAAEANNGRLSAGAASLGGKTGFENRIKIMALKCDDDYETGRHITASYLYEAIDYAVNQGAHVINISYSAPESTYGDGFALLQNKVNLAVAAGVCIVASAGNDKSDAVRYPAGLAGVIGVGASNSDGKLAKYSNHSAAVDIVAPSGEEQKRLVFSTCPTTIRSGGYAYSGGTSYAAPQVAATVAMMMKIKPGLTPNQYLSRIRNRSTVDVDRTEGDDDQVVESFKLLNAGRAVYLMEEP